MSEICPDCEIEMKKEVYKKPFGNPIKIESGIVTEVCPKCGFRVVPEEELGTIRRAVIVNQVYNADRHSYWFTILESKLIS